MEKFPTPADVAGIVEKLKARETAKRDQEKLRPKRRATSKERAAKRKAQDYVNPNHLSQRPFANIKKEIK